ncbi:MAG: hydantoinase/oxoprolinase family protein [Hyphomicrobiales bacterium]|nr:hydantoinase/oxoprolinase family protein [Hyphomicrobiales bacterium]
MAAAHASRVARRVAGIDIGGTFTDLLIAEESEGRSRVRAIKIPTNVADRAAGVIEAISSGGAKPGDLDFISHGTTATTNAILERKIARVGLITTAGFRDVLELGRRTRPSAYGMTGVFEPLIERQDRLEVPERMGADGSIVTPLDEAAVGRAVRALLAAGCEALVIHFLHAYANPAHELLAGEIARRLWPNPYVTLGHELLSEFREYERGTTASVNAAVQPILARYVDALERRLAAGGYCKPLMIMNGNGGTMPARAAITSAAKTVMSGPASGVMAAAATLAGCGVSNAITYDMGGTSTDVALIHGGIPEVSSELSLAYGLPIHVPMVDVRTVGAGGGSIARIDAAGMLRVGPDSAGATPGPICFNRGGSEPTITDANLLLGRLPPAGLTAVAGGSALSRVREVFADVLGRPLGMSAEEAAQAVLTLANLTMSGAIRMVSLQRGHDPRDFALFAFGGAGPLHAVALARELGVPQVIVPSRPGLTNALGCLVADLRQDFVQTVNVPLDDADMSAILAVLDRQERNGRAQVSSEADEIVGVEVRRSADMQFRGQTHLVRVALPSVPLTRQDLQVRFERAYFARFQIRMAEIRAQIVNLNTSVIGRRRAFDLTALFDASRRAATANDARSGVRAMFAGQRWHEASVFDRERLPIGTTIDGPAIVEQFDATTVIEPGARARVDDGGNLRIEVSR